VADSHVERASLYRLCAAVVGKLKGIGDCLAGIIDRARHSEIPQNNGNGNVASRYFSRAVRGFCSMRSFCAPATIIPSLEASPEANVKREG
jgi:hypothetical protein